MLDAVLTEYSQKYEIRVCVKHADLAIPLSCPGTDYSFFEISSLTATRRRVVSSLDPWLMACFSSMSFSS